MSESRPAPSHLRTLVFGWGNARPSQIAAYERLHRASGRDTASVIADTRAGLLDGEAHARAVRPLAQGLLAEQGDTPLLVHAFSDNGFIAWAAFLDTLARDENGENVRRRIRGVVFDSAPGLWNVRGKRDFAQRFSLGMTPAISRLIGLGAREHLPIVTPVLAGLFVAYPYLRPKAVRSMVSSGERVLGAGLRCPHLFLYGGKDELVPPSDVRAFIARLRSAGLRAEESFFPAGRHVALYPTEPSQYRDALASFTSSLDLT